LSGSRERHDIIVIGGSAGGLEILTRIVATLPPDLEAAVFAVIHTGARTPAVLQAILSRSGKIAVKQAEDEELIRSGRVYVPQPDHHLLLHPDHVRVARGPKENGFRPAVDPLFRTAARAFGARVIGVVLSGALDDGTHGLSLIKQNGGIAVVQDPQEALVGSMPLSACQNVAVDHIVPSADLGRVLVQIVQERKLNNFSSGGKNAMDADDQATPDIAQRGSQALSSPLYDTPPSALTCPKCGGALWEMKNGDPIRFRCHVGHSFTGEGLLDEQDQNLEIALWTAVRALDESAALNRKMATRAGESRLTGLALAYEWRAAVAQEQANVVRALLVEVPITDSVESVPTSKKGTFEQVESRAGPMS
jgi:two-component system chemotaxis response regulator CheB